MKKLLVFALLLLTTGAFAQFKLGAHVGYGLDAEKAAFGVNAEFFLSEKLSIAPNLTFYSKEKADFGSGYYLESSIWMLNADVHYYFVSQDALGIYGLAGLGMAFAKIKGDLGFGEFDESDSEIGLNLGAGISFLQSGKVNPFAELKYETNVEQVFIMGGVRFKLK